MVVVLLSVEKYCHYLDIGKWSKRESNHPLSVEMAVVDGRMAYDR
jgi:hypothetical protein